MRQETPSTARWWTTSSSRAGPSPPSNSAARSSGPRSRSRLACSSAGGPRQAAIAAPARSTRAEHVAVLGRRDLLPPGRAVAAEAQAQRVVVDEQRAQRLAEQRRVQIAGGSVEQHRLVEVVRRRQVVLEEPALDRRQRQRAR